MGYTCKLQLGRARRYFGSRSTASGGSTYYVRTYSGCVAFIFNLRSYLLPRPRPCPTMSTASEEHRSRLCRAIASLPSSVTSEEAFETLDPIVVSFVEKLSSDENDVSSSSATQGDDDGVTPLVVACDKAQLSVLEYIGKQILADTAVTELLGNPLNASSTKVGGNTAAHHAASVGFAEGIDWLVRILKETKTSLEPDNPAKEDVSYSCAQYLLHLLSQQNANGDTAIMFASASGQTSVIKHWISQLNESNIDNGEVRQVFEMRNEGGDTACSLACGHGIYSIVKLLIEPSGGNGDGLIEASHSDLQKCRAALSKMDSLMPMVKRKGNQIEQDEFCSRRKDTQHCIQILKDACEKLAEKKMSELLGGESVSASVLPTKVNNKKKQAKKRDKKNRKKIAQAKASSADDEGRPALPTAKGQSGTQKDSAWKVTRSSKDRTGNQSSESDLLTSPRVVTLQDGTVISTSERTSYVADSDKFSPISEEESDSKTAADKSVDEMLRDICRERHVQPEVEAIMDSLCLDTSMLLLTSHGMALDLSPCQLDAVESILKTQLINIEEAKKIQARIRSQEREND